MNSKPRTSGACDICGGNHELIIWNNKLGFICYECSRKAVIQSQTCKFYERDEQAYAEYIDWQRSLAADTPQPTQRKNPMPCGLKTPNAE